MKKTSWWRRDSRLRFATVAVITAAAACWAWFFGLTGAMAGWQMPWSEVAVWIGPTAILALVSIAAANQTWGNATSRLVRTVVVIIFVTDLFILLNFVSGLMSSLEACPPSCQSRF